MNSNYNDNQITITCKTSLVGRYLSVQKKMEKAFTILEINQISYNPPPSNYLSLFWPYLMIISFKALDNWILRTLRLFIFFD